MTRIRFAALSSLLLLVARAGAGAALVEHAPAHGRNDHATGELDDGQRYAEETEDGCTCQLKDSEEDNVVDGDAAREGAKNVRRRIADQPEEDQRGAERVDQRQKYAERNEKDFPDRHKSSPSLNFNGSPS